MNSIERSLYLFHHVFLPPKVPQKNDFQPEYGHIFFDVFEQALQGFDRLLPHKVLDTISKMIVRMRAVHDQSTGDVIGDTLTMLMEDMVKHGMPNLLIVDAMRRMLIPSSSRRMHSVIHQGAECWHTDEQFRRPCPVRILRACPHQ